MPLTSKTQQGTPRKHSDNKNDADSNSKPTIDYRAMGRQAYIAGDSKNQPGLGGKNKKQFDKGYDAESKRKLLAKQKEAREAKKQEHLLELEENADNEKILRMMCDKNGILDLVETKYKNMVLFVVDIMNQQGEENMKKSFCHAVDGFEFLGKEYKNVVNHYTNKVKKLNPKDPVVQGAQLFVEWLATMKKDSEAIKKKRNDLYMDKDIGLKLEEIKQNITPVEIDAIKKLIQKKLQAEDYKRLHVLAKQNKKDRRASARAKRGDMSGRSSYGSSANSTPRTVGNETSGEFSDEN
jgi:hypothetical protein